jgi:uncharacterized protein with HEPN domain
MKKVEIILMHIKEDCTDIKNFIKDINKEQFLQSALIKKAVCMSLINIGELVKTLPKDFCMWQGDVSLATFLMAGGRFACHISYDGFFN